MQDSPENFLKVPAQSEERWSMMFDLLSMDMVFPFIHMMGLRLDDPYGLQRVLRALINRQFSFHDQRTYSRVHYSPEQMLSMIAEFLGAPVRDVVAWWSQNIFDYTLDDHRDLDAWTNLFRYSGDDSSLWRDLRNELRDETLEEFRISMNTREYAARWITVQENSLSEWDRSIYARVGFNDSDPALANGPDTYILPTVKTYRGYRFLEDVINRFTPTELAIFYEHALEIAAVPENRELMTPLRDLNVFRSMIAFYPAS